MGATATPYGPPPIAPVRILAEAAAANPGGLPTEVTTRCAAVLEWARSVEASFGRAAGGGIAAVVRHCRPDRIHRYLDLITDAGTHGPALGKRLAELLEPLMRHGTDAMIDRFMTTVAVMRQKGTYTLNHGLTPVGHLVDARETDAADAYLALAAQVFALPLTYNRCLYLSEAIPRAVMQMPQAKRPALIAGLRRLVAVDPALIDPFLEGIARGVALLDAEAIAAFVDAGIAANAIDPRKGRRHLSLASHSGRDAWNTARRAATLSVVQGSLTQYLHARLGRAATVAPMSTLPDGVMAPWPEAIPLAATDGTTVYLPDHLEVYDSLNKNAELFTNLVRLEAGLLECGTYDFDLERVRAACGIRSPTDPIDPPQGRSDMERFFLGFADPALAWDLFSMIEHGRITRQLTNVYPGLFRRTDPLIADDLARRAARGNAATLRLAHVYCALVAVTLPPGIPPLSPARQHWLADFTARAAAALPPGAPVTAAARFLHAAYAELAEILVADDDRQRLDLPFGRRVRPDLALRADPAPDRLATAIVARYRRAGVGVYKTTVRTALADASRGTIAEVTIPPDPDHPLNANGIRTAASLPDIRDLLAGQAGVRTMTEDISGRIYWYPEWDARLGDFLDRHCRVVVQCSADGPVEAYQAIVNRHEALVTDIRLAFERIRPEGVALLRQWVDGDDFDYRALVDYAVDRAGGRSPSDRLYLKRLKQYRDVAVLLLVDLSRSTAGPAGHDPNQTVLDVERTAIALLCEALETLGDTYALAGFSGHGRQDVRYWPIKSFDAPLNEAVRGRIGALRPHRSTRMGAAIRHAAAELARVPCAVRLLLVLGDGFPNDIDYKKDYAIEDTRRAIGEARAHRIFTHGITVNVTADPKLDRLFGPTHQSVITDVTELPQRLWRIYHALTH